MKYLAIAVIALFSSVAYAQDYTQDPEFANSHFTQAEKDWCGGAVVNSAVKLSKQSNNGVEMPNGYWTALARNVEKGCYRGIARYRMGKPDLTKDELDAPLRENLRIAPKDPSKMTESVAIRLIELDIDTYTLLAESAAYQASESNALVK